MHWDRIQDVARNITLFFGKDVGSRKKCPCCKGSGLRISGAQHQQSGIRSNEPCWFCEGIGSLPIFGLNGFVLARATSNLQTCDPFLQSCSSLKADFHFEKFSETRCNIRTFKPNGQMADMLHDFSSIPLWLMCTQERDSCCGSSQGSQFGSHLCCKNDVNTSARSSEPCVSDLELQSMSNSSKGLNVQRFPYLSYLLERKDTRVSPKKLSLQCDIAMAATRERSEADFCTAEGIRFGFSGISFAHLVNSSAGQLETESCQHLVPASHIGVLIGPRLRSPIIFGSRPNTVVSCSRRRRSSRKERNRIREKAEKDASERARRIAKTLDFYKEESHVVENKELSEDLQSFNKQHSSEVAGRLHENWTGRAQLFPSLVSSKSASMRSLALSSQSWINDLVSGKVQDLLHITESGKP